MVSSNIYSVCFEKLFSNTDIYIVQKPGILIIFLGVREWSRNTTSRQLVEDALIQQRGRTIPVCHEAQGESIAISHDGVGFYTVSEAKGEDKSGTKIDIPMYYYSFSKGKGRKTCPIT